MKMPTMSNSESQGPKVRGTRFIIGCIVTFLIGLFVVTIPMLVEEIGPDDIVAIQAPVSGKITWYTTQGWAYQGYGTVTTYKKRETFNFPCETDSKGSSTGGIELRFSDGGHGTMCGSVQFNLPLDDVSLSAIIANYHGQDAIVKNLLSTVVNKSVYMTGPLMTSKESYAEKRNDLIHYVADQIQNGVYRTRQQTKWVKDDITNQSKEIITAEIILNKDNKPERQEDSVLNHYHITTFNFAIEKMPYDDAVEAQIRQQQKLSMDVQTKIAEAKKAEQEKLTEAAIGEANATRTKWEQETIKAREVTKAEQEKAVQEMNAARDKNVASTKADQDKVVAETRANQDKIVAETNAAQRLNVADLDRKAAEQKKSELTLLGEGEAARKRAVIEADGALEQKLRTYEAVNAQYANALRGSTWVPSIIMGSQTTGGGNSQVSDLLNILTAKTAKDLSLDMRMSPGRSQSPIQGQK